ncbi:MAG: exodeoxyribonuclease V subunit alpha [Kofleriaceae bacterium]|nr:exodeoxyribonuclease V subunit alpha [Kofleriaceae bacterium]
MASRFDDARRGDELRARLGAGARRFDLGDQGLYLAEEVVDCDPFLPGRDAAALTAALIATQVAARQGSTWLPLDGAGAAPLREIVAALLGGPDGAAPTAMVDGVVADVLRLARQPALGGLVGAAGQLTPLVVDDDCLYQHRLWWLETELAAALGRRLAGDAIAADAAAVPAAVEAVTAAPAGVVLTPQQVAAVRTALTGRLGVVSGGPGTGKTAIVVSLVRALARLDVDAAGGVALAAPTGKAAARMTESVARALAAIGAGGGEVAAVDAALAATPPAAQTVHRLLGWRPGGAMRHGKGAPLPHAAVIVDEASMIDLALMERLVQALRPDARLILLGDAHQLPSVDAGAVLADLVALAGKDGAPWAITLTESHRMRADDPDGRAVLEAARAVDAGLPHRLFDGAERLVARRAAVRDATGRGVELVTIETAAQLGVAIDQWWRAYADDPRFDALIRRGYRRRGVGWVPGDDDALAELLGLHERRRLLAVTRGLDTGTEAINARLHAMMLTRSSTELAPEFVPGEPVLITANDYERSLFNGDQGVVVRVVDDDGAQRYRAVFRRGAELIALPLDAVRSSMELAWAMTVHKSQGSELDHVALLLPRDDLPLCTRELVYTALTRARRGALILGTADGLVQAVERGAVRRSGLAGRLAAALAAAAPARAPRGRPMTGAPQVAPTTARPPSRLAPATWRARTATATTAACAPRAATAATTSSSVVDGVFTRPVTLQVRRRIEAEHPRS